MNVSDGISPPAPDSTDEPDLPAVNIRVRSFSFAPGRPEQLLTNHSGILLWLISGLYFLGFGAGAWGLPLSSDEVFSHLVARNTPAGILAALAHGADTHPPLHYLILHLAYSSLGRGQFAGRLPFLAAGLAAALLLYSFARVRLEPCYALVAPLFFLLTAHARVAFVTRPYALMMLAYSMGLWFWQRTDGPRRRTLNLFGLGCAMGIAVTSHFYGGLLALAIGSGEAMRSWRSNRFQWSVWLTLLAGTLPIYFLLPQIRAISATVGSAMLNHGKIVTSPTAMKLLQTYTTFLNPALVASVVIGVGLLMIGGWPHRIYVRPNGSGLAGEEILTAAVMIAIPLLLYVLGVRATGVFNPGYGYMAALGAALIASQAASWLTASSRRNGALPAVCLLLVFCGQQASLSRTWRPHPWNRYQVASVLMASEAAGTGPIVVSQLIPFTQLFYYAPDNLRSRLHYLIDVSEASRFGDSSTDVALRELRPWTGLPVDDYAAFTSRQSSFLVYDWGFEPAGWLIPYLRQSHAEIQVLDTGGVQKLMLVTVGARP
jgi:hypothetical protein